jgi:hypothetical protein
VANGELNFASKKHRAFLQMLIDDDDARAEYEKDPVGVAARHGIGHDPENPPTRGPLPSKQEIRDMLDSAVRVMNESGGHPSVTLGTPIFNAFK